ncbi:unnamed protein product [Acanthoscelides obtectus]|uniref:HTH CENPB-type domain-containing protein n=1 Tax=Acanthoscelides obtectus TaxID=200917 RepID=A0A9P0L6V8_ACAOB|nr:unnamed protein product [Acanthoscelides obtectus]CAK1648278.1 hypothetical protein AOBTE_LOCUS15639 [Acanthoscelides obtectus]
MPRSNPKYVKKDKRKSWKKEDMETAITVVREKKMGTLKAAKTFNVPRTTLQTLSKKLDLTPAQAVCTKLGRKPYLGEDLEKELVSYLLIMEQKFYGYTIRDLRRMAYQIAIRNHLETPFNRNEAGRSWVDLFLNRHKEHLSIRKPCGTSFSRALGFNKENVQSFFNMLEEAYEKHKFPAERVFNVDETGLSIVQSKIPHVIGRKGKKQIAALTSAERGSTVTIIACMSASGVFVPPLVIFPRTNMTQILMKGCPPGSIGRAHPSGWVQSNIFTDWFAHFIEKVCPTENSPVLLILDGHYSHVRNPDLIDMARKSFVTIICLPPHSTHKLQPLDKTFMGPLKAFYSEEADQSKVVGSTSSSHASFSQCCSSSTPKNLPGPSKQISPFQIAPVPNIKKKVTNRGRKSSSACVITDTPYKEELSKSLEKSAANMSKKKLLFNDFDGSKKKSSNKMTKRPKISSKPESESSDSDGDLPDDSSSDIERPNGHYPDDEDASCLFCNGMFSEDTRGEVWVKCFQCFMWAHSDYYHYETEPKLIKNLQHPQRKNNFLAGASTAKFCLKRTRALERSRLICKKKQKSSLLVGRTCIKRARDGE